MAQLRILLDDSTARVDADLLRMWAVAWEEIVDEWRGIVTELADTSLTVGRRRQLIYQSERIRKALQTAAEKLDDLARQTGARIRLDLPGVLYHGDDILTQVVRSQLPPALDPAMSRMSVDALDAIVGRSIGQIESRLRPLSRDASAVMRAELIRGVAAGTNPNEVARHVLRRVQDGFDGGLARARTIARTEMLDAHRTAARAGWQANSDIVTGWRWLCTPSSRTCPSCLAMNGEVFDLDTPGPEDHPNGRCVGVPVTKSWADLGIDLDEPVGVFPDARAWFDGQSEAVQLDIMGRQRLADLRAGRISWEDIPVRRENPGWRPSWGTRPLAGRRS